MATVSDNLSDAQLDKCRHAAEVCACFHFRRASRAVTQLFDEILRPSGVRSTQLVILINVALNEPVNSAHLARELVMDRSTVVRNLKPLVKGGLITVQPGKDRRTRVVSLTQKGRRILLDAVPLWEQAQHRFVSHVGTDRFRELLGELGNAVNVMQDVNAN